jgi:iron complex outermembrane recepter protein
MSQNKLVLLVDDDPDDQEIFEFALRRADESATCIFADDGRHALERLQNETDLIPDIIFIDMNMPRMNGKQCLASIKEIERFKNVPVYMYSTGADPQSVKENMELGAEDYIIKPSDVDTLAGMLSSIFKKRFITLMMAICCLSFLPSTTNAQDTIANTDSVTLVRELKRLSFEQLMNIVVTSASKSPEKLSETSAAIQVITAEDIRRSSATRLPEALRLATNLQVAQSGSHDWGITARGFNGLPVASSSLANKLLVMIDGRSVYTPLFGGVFWDVQNVMMQDIDQIEVISGPGGALWGANAVNGIININSKNARETQGLYVTGIAGTFLNHSASARYGGQADSALYYRVYGQRFGYNDTYINGKEAGDAWSMNQGGFRIDYLPGRKNTLTLQGDLYEGIENDSASTLVNGQNILGRWTHNFSETNIIALQLYFDRTYRNIQVQHFRDEMNTADIDFQHNIPLGIKHKLVWGFNMRLARNEIESILDDFIPARRDIELYSVFLQDQVAIVKDKLDLTIGLKVLHNEYTGIEYHPTVRSSFRPAQRQTLWVAVSQGIRTPTRYDADNASPVLGSFGEMQSENVIAYEAGYRIQIGHNLALSASGYYNVYTDLRSIDTNSTPLPAFYWANNLEAESYGFEFSMNFMATENWKLRGGYTWLDKKFTVVSHKTYPYTELFEAIDPHNQFLLQSMIAIGKKIQFDQVLRYVDVLPSGFTPSVPSYVAANLRLGYQYKWFAISVGAQNLAFIPDTQNASLNLNYVKRHREFGRNEVPPNFYGKLTLKF